MVRALLILLWLALPFAPAPAAAQTLPGVELWVDIDDGGRPVHAQQMVLLRVRGRFDVPVTLEKMVTPDLPGFRLMQIGRDRWFEVFEDGRRRMAFQRTIAAFPQRSGSLTIAPFTHQLTVVDRGTHTVTGTAATAPVVLTVEPAPVAADAWWLPAGSVTVTDAWTVEPDALGIGKSTHRTVTIRATGVFDDQLPPPPKLQTQGLIVFPGLTRRSTEIGLGGKNTDGNEMALRDRALRRPGRLKEVESAVEGPVAEVVYEWDIRPSASAPVTLPEIVVPWYDTTTGTMRSAKIPPRVVSLAAVGPDTAKLEQILGIVPEPVAGPNGRLGGLVAVLAGGLTFAVASFALVALVDPARLTAARRALAIRRRRADLRRRLRAAAARGDAAALRAELLAWNHLVNGDDRPRSGAVADAIAILDAHLYAPGNRPAPDLAAFVRSVLAAQRQDASSTGAATARPAQ